MTRRAGKPGDVPELPKDALRTYALLWQFEIWLRRLVYVELKSQVGDCWGEAFRRAISSRDADKRLTHMPTIESELISYAQLSNLREIISENWNLFKPFLPPKEIWAAKLEEVGQIRNRIAHFRVGHKDDLARVVQFLRDLDHGFWKFCTSYNNSQPILPQKRDPVVKHFLSLDVLPWVLVGKKQWARVGIVHPSERLTVTVDVMRRPYVEWSAPVAGKAGFLYDVSFLSRGQWHIDIRRTLEDTESLHVKLVHVCLDHGQGSLRITVPAVMGAKEVIRIVEEFEKIVRNRLRPGVSEVSSEAMQKIADSLPEVVLGPKNPLTFLDPKMPCSFFSI